MLSGDWERIVGLPSVLFNHPDKISTETRRHADLLFAEAQAAGLLGSYLTNQKRRAFCEAVHFGRIACLKRGTIAYARNRSNPTFSEARMQAIEALTTLGYFSNHVAPRKVPGMDNQTSYLSRAKPLGKYRQQMELDPWLSDRPDQPLVLMHRRSDKEEICFDHAHPTAIKYQKRLEKINAVNSKSQILCRLPDEWEQDRLVTVQLRPVHYAVFTDDFEHHGRVYTGRYGHQGLAGAERETITFDGTPSVELDYSGFHPRLLYHLAGVNYRSDPYALWRDATTGPQRLMAKVFVNALINAKDSTAAVSACNLAMSPKTQDGHWKEGKAANDASLLRKAVKKAKLRFSQLLAPAYAYHKKIRGMLHRDMGITLMNKDGELALAVMYHFARQNVPCLGCHDSFIVPEGFGAELRSVMIGFYRKRFKFRPLVR